MEPDNCKLSGAHVTTSFREATDRLAAAFPLAKQAAEFGVDPASYSKWRRGDHRLQPPEDWPHRIAEMAAEGAGRLDYQADDLRALQRELTGG